MRLTALALTMLIVASATWMTATFAHIVGADGFGLLDATQTTVFALLALWLAQAFWVPVAGWARRVLARTPPERRDGRGRTAIVVPIYNEDARDVFARVGAVWDGLAATPDAARFDLFVLSDSTEARRWLDELEFWDQVKRRRPEAPIYYRRRLRNARRKVGNIADFVRRWGAAYDYMVVLDADSLMSASTLRRLVWRMDAEPELGLLQAPPSLVNGETWFARHLQFGGELAGGLTASGVASWAGDCGNYWGHNAIIRVAAFARHAGLPDLPGSGPLGGEIMSHDFVEAALLRRAGWRVRMADDLDGSYEEPPPTVRDFVTRDRRWCRGNLQHLHVLVARDLHLRSRLHFLVGIASYVTAPLWFAFLVLAGIQGIEAVHDAGPYFRAGVPFPIFPEPVALDALALLVVTLGSLFVPKVLGFACLMADGRRRRHLNPAEATVGLLLEALVAALLAPIMMIFQSRIVLALLAGGTASWQAQQRRAAASSLRDAWTLVRMPFAVAVVATTIVVASAPSLTFWMLPVVAGPLAAPFLVWTLDRVEFGQSLRVDGLLVIPAERAPPPVTVRHRAWRDRLAPRPTHDVFAQTVLDADRRARHLALLDAEPTVEPASDLALLKASRIGPMALTDAEMKAVLEDGRAFRTVVAGAREHWPQAPSVAPVRAVSVQVGGSLA